MFRKVNIIPAQILLTRGDFSNRERYRNAFATITELLERGILPIINENDTVVIDELTFGDNDMLSALVSGFIHADQLRSEEHTSELQSRGHLVCRLLLEKKKQNT